MVVPKVREIVRDFHGFMAIWVRPGNLRPHPGPGAMKGSVIMVRYDVGPALDERDGTRVPQSTQIGRTAGC